MELCQKIILFFLKKKSQTNTCFKLMPKPMPYFHVIKILVDDYGFKIFIRVKTVVMTNYGFRLKVKIVVGDYKFNHFQNRSH